MNVLKCPILELSIDLLFVSELQAVFGLKMWLGKFPMTLDENIILILNAKICC